MWDAEDRRLVQAAVVGDRDSDAPVVMPADRTDAHRFRLRYQSESFWCGALLGGCGGQLMTKIYGDRVCHFAHHPSVEGHCGRSNRGLDSADHLYISRELKDLRGGLLRVEEVIFDFDTPNAREGASCTGLTFKPDQGKGGVLAVKLANDDFKEWARLNERYRQEAPWVQWLFGERSAMVHWAVEQEGYGFRIKCEQRDGLRAVLIGTVGSDHIPRWSDASECAITSSGLWTPHLDGIREKTASITVAPMLTSPSVTSTERAEGERDERTSATGDRLTQSEFGELWRELMRELRVARATAQPSDMKFLVDEARSLAHDYPGWVHKVDDRLRKYDEWLALYGHGGAHPIEPSNNTAATRRKLSKAGNEAMAQASELIKALLARDRPRAVELHQLLQEAIATLPSTDALRVERKIDPYEEPLRLARIRAEATRKQAEAVRKAEERKRRQRETELDDLAAIVREALVLVARDRVTATWAQLRQRADGELKRLRAEDEIEILRRVDAASGETGSLLSALVVDGGGEMNPQFPTILGLLGRDVVPVPHEQWATEVLRAHQSWHHT